LADSHGIGGDPGRGEIYGFASWTPRMGILALRNPTGRLGRFDIDLQDVFELPAGVPRRYSLQTPWRKFSPVRRCPAEAGKLSTFSLAPWETLVLEAHTAR